MKTLLFGICPLYCCYNVHLRAMCALPLNNNVIISQVKLLQATIQFGLWAAVDDVKRCKPKSTILNIGVSYGRHGEDVSPPIF